MIQDGSRGGNSKEEMPISVLYFVSAHFVFIVATITEVMARFHMPDVSSKQQMTAMPPEHH